MTSFGSWRTLTVEQCCLRVTSGGTPSRRNPSFYVGGTIPWAKTGELKDRIVDPARIGEWITEEALAKSSAKLLPKDTVLMAMYGDGQTIGSLGLVQSPISCNQACCAMIPDPTICDARFLFYSLRSYRDDWIKIAHGGAQRNLSGTIIRGREITVPPLPNQQRIAAILSAYDDLIENNTRRIAILEEMARRLYEEWFVHFRFPGHEEAEFRETEFGITPCGWPVVPLENLVQINPRTPVPRDGLKPFVPMGSLSETIMSIGPVEERDGNSGTKFQNGDTLVARITPCLENGKTGFVDFLDDERPAAFGSTEFMVLRPSVLGPCAIYCLARSHVFRDVAIKSMSGAEGRQRVRPESIKMFPIAHPPADLLARFERFAGPVFAQVSALARKNANLRAQRDLLLPKLVSGEIDVSAAEAELEAAE